MSGQNVVAARPGRTSPLPGFGLPPPALRSSGGGGGSAAGPPRVPRRESCNGAISGADSSPPPALLGEVQPVARRDSSPEETDGGSSAQQLRASSDGSLAKDSGGGGGDVDAATAPTSAASPADGGNLRLRSTTSMVAGKDLVVAGTLDAFIEKLLQDARATKLDYDYDFIDLFLVSHPCFVPSEEVLTRLVNQYKDAPLKTKDQIATIVKKWWDVHGLRHKEGLVSILQTWLLDPVVFPEHADMLKNLMKRCPPGPAPVTALKFSDFQTESKRKINLVECSPRAVAEQICNIDGETFSGLTVDEFYHQNWIKHTERAPHLKSLTDRFNKMSYWLQTEIVTTISLKDRVKLVSKIVNLGAELYELRNYNSCVMVWSALGSSSICRLKYTFSQLGPVEKEQMERLNAMMESTNGFKNYRALTKNCMPPMIPYFGLTMTDLVYMDEKADKVDDLINFEKWSQVGKTLLDMRSLQREVYKFPPMPVYQDFFRSLLPLLAEVDIRKYSLMIEPRDMPLKDVKKIKKRDPSLPLPSISVQDPSRNNSPKTSSSLIAGSSAASAPDGAESPSKGRAATVSGTMPRNKTAAMRKPGDSIFD